jgi:L-lactate utilization protein LutB
LAKLPAAAAANWPTCLLLLLLQTGHPAYCCCCCCRCCCCCCCKLANLLLLLQVRTSTGTFFDKDYDEVVTAVEERVSLVTMLPKANQEGLQVLRYVDGQKYEPHHGEGPGMLILLVIVWG